MSLVIAKNSKLSIADYQNLPFQTHVEEPPSFVERFQTIRLNKTQNESGAENEENLWGDRYVFYPLQDAVIHVP